MDTLYLVRSTISIENAWGYETRRYLILATTDADKAQQALERAKREVEIHDEKIMESISAKIQEEREIAARDSLPFDEAEEREYLLRHEDLWDDLIFFDILETKLDKFFAPFGSESLCLG